MAMDLAPWLAQPIADPSQAYLSGFGHGAQIGAQQAEQRIRQQSMDMQAQQHAVELQQRAIEFSMKLEEQRQQAEELKAHQQQQFELEGRRISEEAARTAMYGAWHTGDIARRTAADQIAAGEKAAYNKAEAEGATTEELARRFPGQMHGAVQLQVATDKNAQVPSIQTLPGSQGPVDVLTQPGTAPKVVPRAPAVRNQQYSARLAGYKTEMANLTERLKKHPSRMDAQLTDAEIAKTKGISMEGVKDYRRLQQRLNDVSEAMAKYRDSQGDLAAPQSAASPQEFESPDNMSEEIDPDTGEPYEGSNETPAGDNPEAAAGKMLTWDRATRSFK